MSLYKKRENPVTKRHSNAQGIKDVVEELLNAYKLRSKYNETYIVSSWEKIMGTQIANRTEKIYVKNKKLFIKLSSAPLKHEFSMAKTKLIDLLNKEAGQPIIEDIVFL